MKRVRKFPVRLFVATLHLAGASLVLLTLYSFHLIWYFKLPSWEDIRELTWWEIGNYGVRYQSRKDMWRLEYHQMPHKQRRYYKTPLDNLLDRVTIEYL